MTWQLVIALSIALAAAIRGNWSPCGESLIAQIHPLGERGRRNNWWVTISAFTVGAIIGGGAIGALFGWVGSLLPEMTAATALTGTALLAAVAGALDLGGVTPAGLRRQVNEHWIGHYRGWVYGSAFGLQLGLGFTVFIMSWGYFAILGAALLGGSAAFGALVGAVFGLARGGALMTARYIDRPSRLSSFHTRMASLRAPVFAATAMAMLLVGVAFAVPGLTG